jgi:hypothetical protein
LPNALDWADVWKALVAVEVENVLEESDEALNTPEDTVADELPKAFACGVEDPPNTLVDGFPAKLLFDVPKAELLEGVVPKTLVDLGCPNPLDEDDGVPKADVVPGLLENTL